MIYVKAHNKAEVGQATNLAISAVSQGHKVTLFADKKLLNPNFKDLYTVKTLKSHDKEELTPCNSICISDKLDKAVFQFQSPKMTLKDIKKDFSFLSLGSHKHYREMAKRILANIVHKTEGIPFHYPV